MQNRYNAVRKCLAHANTLCRMYGGCRPCTVRQGLEHEAREDKKGLWVDPAPIPPWVYRKARRGQMLDVSDLAPLVGETRGSGTSHGPPQVGAVEPESSPYPSSAIERAISITGLTAQTTAKLRHAIEWSLIARQKRKRLGIEWRENADRGCW